MLVLRRLKIEKISPRQHLVTINDLEAFIDVIEGNYINYNLEASLNTYIWLRVRAGCAGVRTCVCVCVCVYV